MDSNSIKINLLPNKKRKTKVNKLSLIFGSMILVISMALAGMFFISEKQVLACTPLEECKEKGFDLFVAKWEWNGTKYVNDGNANGTNVSGDSITASWTAYPSVAGVISKEGLSYFVHLGGLTGIFSKTGKYAISHITFCGNKTFCGNNIIDGSEECDGDKPVPCAIDGYEGLMYCTSCLWGKCIPKEYCGDGIKNGSEECDILDGVPEHYVCNSECKLKYLPYCGDGNVDLGEECDDGNTNNLDACRNSCDLPTCGDGIKDADEQCDDGNTVDGDGCSSVCTTEHTGPICGNGVVESGEECDDGNTNNLDACRNSCDLPTCGDGIKDADEQCDDGNNVNNDGCSVDCIKEELTIKAFKVVCDTEVDLPDWGLSGYPSKPSMIISNTAQGYVSAMSGKCHLEAGWDFQWGFDGVVAKEKGDFVGPAGSGWQNFDSSTGDSGVTPAIVKIDDLQGKTKLWVRENLKNNYIPFANPDGNLQASTSAEIYCHKDILNFDNYDRIDDAKLGETYYCVAFNAPKPIPPFCGDGKLDSGEECDDGNAVNGDGCSSTCSIEHSGPICGNGIIESGEICDDGNTVDNDGCDSSCQPERGSLIVCKYNDLNKNSAYDIASDTPLVWNMVVTYPNSSTTTVQTSSTTGCYLLTDLPYGSYQVEEETKTGWVKSYPNDNPVTTSINSENKNPNVTFLNYEQPVEPKYGSIRVCKLIDSDGSASTTDDQYAATSSAWSFSLISTTGTTTKITNTEDNCVLFSGLLAGNYQIQEEEQGGWRLIDPTVNNIDVALGVEENKVLTFVNSVIVVPKSSISGYKYNDANNNGVIDDGEQKMSGWQMQLIGCPYPPLGTSTIQFLPNSRWNTVSTSTEPISGQCTVIATTTTDGTGYYEFAELNAGDYGVSEVITDSGWSQTYPVNDNFYYFNLPISENRTNINFANYKPGDIVQPYCGDGKVDSGEQCDDGNNTSGDGCSSTCTTEGGGGGGGYITMFDVYDTVVTEENCNAVFTWRTSTAATSRVYYDTVPHENSTLPSSDYPYATIEDVSKVTGHNVKITDLKPGVTYYFRAYSQDSSTKYSQEVAYKISDSCGPVIKGEEGKPVLAITKVVNVEFANPGQTGIEYLITISNNGNLTAYDVKLKDLLPAGLIYADLSGNTRSWNLGDMKPGENKAVTYKANVSKDAKSMIYVNTAEATASNADAVKATADLEVRTIKVLAITGFSIVELFVMFSALICLVSLSIFLRRKIALNED